ncbi:arylsulfatase [Cyclobacterium qasimii]|uniref:Arylsulfatase n=2 Tax=Cyclobacterium qasimii TaxID=1350429 RepID=S7VMU6_9BACT|nr:arylsulfatase [Cyclobacterium qasimii]EPR71535.1 Arylsulfatase [Cyclobacterium qasimii M12-11B]GEO20248.1 arylsulfatase [Cyclobacterium qasimii]
MEYFYHLVYKEKKLFKTEYLMILCVLSFYGCQQKASIEAEDIRPNIILIMADDMGYSDLGAFGGEINTPNLDKLAADGLLMTQFYNSSRCCPSRAALLTGLYQHEAGVGNMTGNMGHPSYQGFLNEQCVTIGEVLQTSGYRTMISGKWHLGGAPEQRPNNRGFDRFFGIAKGGVVYFNPIKSGSIVLDSAIVPTDTSSFYSTDAFNDYAVSFIKEHMENRENKSRQPFFLYLAHVAPHFPLQAKAEDIAKYRGKYKEGFDVYRNRRLEKMKELQIIPSSISLSSPDDKVLDWNSLSEAEKDTFDLRMATYAAQVDCMDQGIGEILQSLEELNINEETVIIFLSDNGATSENVSSKEIYGGPIGSSQSYTSYTPSWANVSNTPFKMYKHWVHEGGISTPLIINYPKLIQKQQINHEMGHIMDIMPTCLDLAQTDYPETYKGNKIRPMRGLSLLPLLTNKEKEPHEWLFWEHQGNSAVRKGDWKLVKKQNDENWALYNIANDRTEDMDLTHNQPDMVKEMLVAYQNWEKEVGVMPWGFDKK